MTHTSPGLTRNALRRQVLTLFLSLALGSVAALAQITPSQDSYTNGATPTTNYGSKTLLDVDGATQITYIQFNLSSIPSGANISQATLKLYVNSVTAAGSFNLDYVNSSWSEGTIDSSNAPPLGGTIASSVPVVAADKNQYLLINISSALQAWLNGTEANNGLALVANGSTNLTFDSKENTTTSHPPELDVVFAGGSGTITGVTTASGSGLQGGGTSGTLSLSLTNACSSGQVLHWNGSAWTCSSSGTGTITGVTHGTGLNGGGNNGNVTLGIANAGVGTAQLSAAGSSAGQVLTSTGSTVNWQTVTAMVPDPLSLTQGSSTPTITAVNTTTNSAVFGMAGSGSGLNFNAGVRGDADTVPGIVGSSSSAAGVYGQSFISFGVYGKAGGNDAVHGDALSPYYSGVGGNNSGGGTGVSGNATGGGPGVSGTSDSGTGLSGSSGSGVGVSGSSTSGYAFSSTGHATQTPTMGGWVKAMVLVDPNSQPPIVFCFNSQLPASQASNPPCGIAYSRFVSGAYTLDFGFPVGERFYSLTPAYTNLTPSVPNGPLTACISPGVCGNLSPNQVKVSVGDSSGANDSAFYLIIY